MPDLPSNAPQMFQLPAPAQINQQPGLMQGLAQGVPTGVNMVAQVQQMRLQQAQIQQMQTQQHLQVVDSLLKNGIEYPALMKALWPTIAANMNKISPDYALDPKQPPEDLGGIFKFLSGTSDALNAGAITMPQAHTVVKQGLQDFKGQPVPAGGVGENQDQRLPGQAGYEQKFNQLTSMGPTMATKGLPMLDVTPEAMQMKSALEQRKQLAINQQTQQQETLRSSASTFMNQSDEFKRVADNYSAFNHLMQMSSQMESQGADTTATVQAEKTALLNFAQMAYPGTGRPGNMEMLETMEKSGPVGTLIDQYLNRLDKGDIMTGKQLKGLRQAALALYQGRESQQSQLEDSYTQNIHALGGDPMQFLKNVRPQSVHSTSKLFPTQTADHDPIIGHTRKFKEGGKVVERQYLGGAVNDINNWAYVSGNE